MALGGGSRSISHSAILAVVEQGSAAPAQKSGDLAIANPRCRIVPPAPVDDDAPSPGSARAHPFAV